MEALATHKNLPVKFLLFKYFQISDAHVHRLVLHFEMVTQF
jgi:hypothetical protein